MSAAPASCACMATPSRVGSVSATASSCERKSLTGAIFSSNGWKPGSSLLPQPTRAMERHRADNALRPERSTSQSGAALSKSIRKLTGSQPRPRSTGSCAKADWAGAMMTRVFPLPSAQHRQPGKQCCWATSPGEHPATSECRVRNRPLQARQALVQRSRGLWGAVQVETAGRVTSSLQDVHGFAPARKEAAWL